MYNRTVKQQAVHGAGGEQVQCAEVAHSVRLASQVSAHRHSLKHPGPDVLGAGDTLPLSGTGRVSLVEGKGGLGTPRAHILSEQPQQHPREL